MYQQKNTAAGRTWKKKKQTKQNKTNVNLILKMLLFRSLVT